MSGDYATVKRWRYKNPDARKANNKRYYDKTADAPNKGIRYTEEEIEKILAHDIPDRELSAKIGRSMLSIQVARSKYKAMEGV